MPRTVDAVGEDGLGGVQPVHALQQRLHQPPPACHLGMSVVVISTLLCKQICINKDGVTYS